MLFDTSDRAWPTADGPETLVLLCLRRQFFYTLSVGGGAIGFHIDDDDEDTGSTRLQYAPASYPRCVTLSTM